MNWWTIGIAVVVGVAVGLLMNRNKNVDFSGIRKLREDEFVKNMRKGQLIDIRTKEEYGKNKIKGARNFKKSQVVAKHSKLRKDQSVYLYCSNGKKSFKAARKMARQGFVNVFVLEGGFEGYKK